MKSHALDSLQNRRYYFLRFSGERGQARGERACLALLRARLALALARLKNAKKHCIGGRGGGGGVRKAATVKERGRK